MSDGAHLVAERFVLGAHLGSGGSADVYAAHDLRTGRGVALKLLHAHLRERPAAREAFLAGARRARGLEHRNIAAVLEVGDDAPLGHTWISQEPVDGMTLAARVAADGPLPAEEAIGAGVGVLRALEAVHAHGLVHRDVTPTNIMIAGTGGGPVASDDIRLLDFGLADRPGRAAVGTDELLSARASGRAGILGNVNYLSPEQARGEPIGVAGDVYQTGALLHFALTGRPPFLRDSAGETVRAHLESMPSPVSELGAGVPRALERVVLRAMLKNPAERFGSAAEMRRALLAVTAAPAPSPTAATRLSAPSSLSPAVPAHEPLPHAHPSGDQPTDASAASAPAVRVRVWVAAAAIAVVVAALVGVLVTRTPSVSIADAPVRTPSPVVSPAVTSTPTLAPTPADTRAPEIRSVPELTRMSLDEAERALAEAGLAVGTITWADGPSVRDTVLETDPAAGSSLARGERVNLTVATGSDAVPDVRGMSRADAVAALRAAGFVPAFVEGADGGQPQDGIALSTDPIAGSVRPVGSTVLVMEAAAPTPTASPSPAPTPAPTPTPGPQP